MSLKVGDVLPDIVLKDHKGNDVKLSELKGKKVLLSYHPLAFTGVCEKQMKNIDEKFDTLKDLNVVPFGLSVDSTFAKNQWAKQMGIENLQLLSDFVPHGFLAKELGIYFEDKGFSGRANILINEEGKIAWIKIYDIPQLPDLEEVIEEIKKI